MLPQFRRATAWSAAACAIGLVLLVGVAVLDQQLLKRLAWPAYLGGTGLLVAVLLVGKVVNGSRRWFGWGSYGIQPSELMKLSLILLGAHLFSSDPQGLSNPLPSWKNSRPCVAFTG